MSDLGLVLAEARQAEGRLWVDEVMVDVSLRGHKHQAAANTGEKETLGFIMVKVSDEGSYYNKVP